MKKRSIGVIIGLMTFALLGVVAMQLYFLRQSYDMQSTLFDSSVHEALNNVASKLSRQDAVNFLNNKVQHDSVQIGRENENKIHHQRKLALLRDSLRHMLQRQNLDELKSRLQVVVEGYRDEFGDFYIGGFVPDIKPSVASTGKTHQKLEKYLTHSYIDPQFGKQLVVEAEINPAWLEEHDRLQKQRQVQQVKRMLEADSLQNLPAGGQNAIQNVIEEYQKSGEPLKNRLNPIWIDTLLHEELHNKGVDLKFNYEVATQHNDSMIYSNAINTTDTKIPVFAAADTYQTSIFGKEVLTDPGMIKVSFPQKNSLILGKMTATMAITAGLLFVLIFCFAYTIFSIIRQKKIAEMKTDFINNMTHEFKTPVSTIMIASEALRDEEIITDKSRISRLANIIYEENERLGSHIERVLNMARIDKNDIKLDKKPLDVNEMISLVVDSMALKLQKCNADVTLDLQAGNAIIKGDELHFSNVLYNLVDNAIKYSEGAPKITITSLNKNGQVIVKVADNGIGMSRDQQAKIFEQFYRIPTGNVHNVKGFGLGLSYVNTIVKRLNGTINVRSEKDKGSEFELKFQGG